MVRTIVASQSLDSEVSPSDRAERVLIGEFGGRSALLPRGRPRLCWLRHA